MAAVVVAQWLGGTSGAEVRNGKEGGKERGDRRGRKYSSDWLSMHPFACRWKLLSVLGAIHSSFSK
jgi:hypothetical protein